jgi:N-methylhydantoinase B
MDRFAQSLDSIPGEREPISWGVYPLMGNDALYVRWNGGGGVGDPLDRVPEAVRRDVEEGIVSAEAAREIYGVVIAGTQLDLPATEALRSRLRAARLVAEAAE